MRAWHLAVVALWAASGDAHASCPIQGQEQRILYGGKPSGSDGGLRLVCPELSRANSGLERLPVVVKRSHQGPQLLKLDSTDREGVSLILARELAQTEADLQLARRLDDGRSDAVRQRIHRLEKDMEALQSEISRLPKR